jgi:DNA mismatch repair protein MutS2
MMDKLIQKLDLTDFIQSFKNHFARDKKLELSGDHSVHLNYINQLSKTDFTQPPKVKNLNDNLKLIKKLGTLKIYEIYEFVKIINYFNYLKKVQFSPDIQKWFDDIRIPEAISDITTYFDKKEGLKIDIDEDFFNVNKHIEQTKQNINQTLKNLASSKKLEDILVDTQVYFINEQECLLAKPGFSKSLSGKVVGRSSGGFFYVSPTKINELKEHLSNLYNIKEEIIAKYEKQISATFHKHIHFLEYINRQFDKFDHYSARVFFAKTQDFEFCSFSKESFLITKFYHPAINNAKPISVDFNKNALFVTGVNAGGKTMLLKSVLSATLLTKLLIPFKIDAKSSKIQNFKNIFAILDDPQSVKNDISTFAGRMVEFSSFLDTQNSLIGVDEIELGTDAAEAAALFKVLIEKLIQNNNKIIITTHHKQLASIMSENQSVELLAAIYNEKQQKPTFGFLSGTIGKSYAFETALRYGISDDLVAKAKEVYGKDSENLNELIQKNVELDFKLNKKEKKLQNELEKVEQIKSSIIKQKQNNKKNFKKKLNSLEVEFTQAITEAKQAVKQTDTRNIHKHITNADKLKKSINIKVAQEENSFKVGDIVKYKSQRGEILGIKENQAKIQCEDKLLYAPLEDLTPSQIKTITKKGTTTFEQNQNASVNLDIHGLRANEAMKKVEKFIDDALRSGLNELYIYHGIGSGILATLTKDYLTTHPKVKTFTDAPTSRGGFGATVVSLA